MLSEHAEEVAANVSSFMMDALQCKEGKWQEIREVFTDGAPGRTAGWLALAAGVFTRLFVL